MCALRLQPTVNPVTDPISAYLLCVHSLRRCEFKFDEDNCLSSVFWVMEGGEQAWVDLGGSRVVLFDTKHATNKYRLKLGCFVSIDKDGNNVILAASLIPEGEAKEDFIWVFEQFDKHFGAPDFMFTDGDLGMAAAFETVFSSRSKHGLCIYHIYKNLFEHMHKVFADGTSEGTQRWRAFVDMFWRIAKASDESMRGEAFASKFAELVQMAEGAPSTLNLSKRAQALDWLRALGTRAEKWAACYTWAYRTLDIHSTQRAEANHSALGDILDSSFSLCTLVETLERYQEHKHIRNHMQAMKAMLQQVRAAVPALQLACARAAPLEFTARWHTVPAVFMSRLHLSTCACRTPTRQRLP